MTGGKLDEPFGGVGSAVQHHVLDEGERIGRQVVVGDRSGRVDDGHVEPLADGVVEEDGVHRLAYVVVAAEGEGEVAYPAAHLGSRQVLVNPLGRPDKVHGIVVVTLDAGGDGQHVGVEDDIAGSYAGHPGEQSVGPGAHLDFAFVGIGLSLFVESHDHHGRPHLLDFAGVLQKQLFALFEADGVDDGLALQASEGGRDDLPFRRIDHHGDAVDVGVGDDEVQEVDHLVTGIEHGIVHVDVDNLGAGLDLLAGDVEGFGVVLFVNEPQELARTGHVAPFADVDEIVFARDHQIVESAQMQTRVPGCRATWRGSGYQRAVGGDVLGSGAATPAHDVDQPLVDKLFNLYGH